MDIDLANSANVIPGYRLERLLGRGGMARVYLAIQESLSRPVALKILAEPDAPTFRERFFQEGRVVAALNHPNVVTIHDLGQVGELYYTSMEYLDGGDLRVRLPSLSLPERLDVVETLCDVLSFVHAKEIVHRDLKPGNVLFRGNGTALLGDFGIAKHLRESGNLTASGEAIGTPFYLSPEQIRGDGLDGRSDLYSLGIMLYELLTGAKPFDGGNYASTLIMHLQAPVPRLPEAFRVLQPALDGLLAKSPDDRFPDGLRTRQCLRELRQTASALQSGAMTAPLPAVAAPGHAPTERLSDTEREAATAAVDATGAPSRSRRSRRSRFGRARWAALVVTMIALGGWLAHGWLADDEPFHLAGLGLESPPDAWRLDVGQRPDREASVPSGSAAATRVNDPPAGEAAGEAAGDDAGEIVAGEAVSPPGATASEPAANGSAGGVESDEGAPGDASDGLAPGPGERGAATPQAVQGGDPEEASDASAARPDAGRDDELTADEARTVLDHLRAGKVALEAYRLTTPSDDNAYDHYQAVLDLAPNHPAALQGLYAVGTRYAWLARSQAEDGRIRQARGYVARGLSVQPDHPELLALKEELRPGFPRRVFGRLRGLVSDE